jgi:hypothetical protein
MNVQWKKISARLNPYRKGETKKSLGVSGKILFWILVLVKYMFSYRIKLLKTHYFYAAKNSGFLYKDLSCFKLKKSVRGMKTYMYVPLGY